LSDSPPDDPAGVYVLNRPSYPYVVSDITFEIIRTWLQDCEAHADCIEAIKTHDDEFLITGPSRLLYLEPAATATSNVRIIDAKGTERYTALSYCWGKDSSMQLLCSTIKAWRKALPLDDLPRTIRDAIFTTRRLGLQYLWVDRICIIQDDREDTTRELSAMARIYQRSFLTLSAASAPSAIDGFLQSHSKASVIMQNSRTALEYRCPDGSKGTVGLKTIALRNEEFKADMKAIDARAWTMQEQMLSTRILHFCSNMLFWKCLCGNGAHMHKEGAAEIPSDWTYMEGSTSRFQSLEWGEVVRDYAQRTLSFPADKLIAISALAEKFARIFKTRLEIERPRYLAGLWEHELTTSLCWYLNTDLTFPRKRPSEYRAPSWSWASVDGAITGIGTYGREALSIEILAYSVEPVSISAPYLSMLSGYLTLKGRLREDIWDRKRQKLLQAMGRNYQKDDAPDGLVDALETDLLENEDGTVPVFCLLMGEGGGRSGTPYGLILVKETEGLKRYRRVGYFELELFQGTGNFIDFSFKDCEEQIVTII
jgi:Heterokaryon incompatibility protein (HET)